VSARLILLALGLSLVLWSALVIIVVAGIDVLS
jgi:hypothetical protein